MRGQFVRCRQSDAGPVRACAWPAAGQLGLARVRALFRVSRVRVRDSKVRVRAWPKCERPTCQMLTE